MENTQSGAQVMCAKEHRERLKERIALMTLEKNGVDYIWDARLVTKRSKAIRSAMSDEERHEIRCARNMIRRARQLINRPTPERTEDIKEKYMKAFSGNLVSVELECVFNRNNPVPSEDMLGCMTEVVGDGSVRYEGDSGGEGAEVKVTMRSENPLRLKTVVDRINYSGGEINKTCGMHVHLDQRGVSKITSTKRAKRLVKCLPALMKLVPQSRLDNRFCQQNMMIPKSGTYRFSNNRYMMINYLPAYRKHKTCEVRLHGGTLDFWKVLGWIKLCQFIQNSSEVDAVAKEASGYYACVTIEKLIRMETFPESIRNYVWRRFRQFHVLQASILREQLIAENRIDLTDGMANS
jgi:hypothetical protein